MRESPDNSPLATRTVLLVPGIGNSGPEHWQSHWARSSAYVRVQQRDWDHPTCSDWMTALEAMAQTAGLEVVIAAHSLGCLLTVHWLSCTTLKIAGALLVAVPDPDGCNFPTQAVGFACVPRARLSCPSTVVASVDDPYGDIQFAQSCADAWGSRFVSIGKAGHINAASGLGEWSAGKSLLQALTV